MNWRMRTFEDDHGPGPAIRPPCCRGTPKQRDEMFKIEPGLQRVFDLEAADNPALERLAGAGYICSPCMWNLRRGRQPTITRGVLFRAQGAPADIVDRAVARDETEGHRGRYTRDLHRRTDA